jgi:hypothetical protein
MARKRKEREQRLPHVDPTPVPAVGAYKGKGPHVPSEKEMEKAREAARSVDRVP